MELQTDTLNIIPESVVFLTAVGDDKVLKFWLLSAYVLCLLAGAEE